MNGPRQVSLWDVDDVDGFGPVAGMTVGPVEQIDVREFCRRWHYTCHEGAALWNYGLYDGPVLVGVVSYNRPSRSVCAAVFGQDYVDNVAHMGRLVCADSAPRNVESRLIGGSLRLLTHDLPRYWAVVTYAAQDVGHIGYIYQATNAIYTGLSRKRGFFTDANGKRFSATSNARTSRGTTHAEYRAKVEAKGWTYHSESETPPKHRYVYILGTPAQRRERRKLLKLPSLPYPKAVGA